MQCALSSTHEGYGVLGLVRRSGIAGRLCVAPSLMALVALNAAVLGGGLGLLYFARCIDPDATVTDVLGALVATAGLTLGASVAALCGWIPSLSSHTSGSVALAAWAFAVSVVLGIRFAARSGWGPRRRVSPLR
jgi:hypothetical protein